MSKKSNLPGNAKDHFFRGLAKSELGDHDSAEADYDRAIELKPALKNR